MNITVNKHIYIIDRIRSTILFQYWHPNNAFHYFYS